MTAPPRIGRLQLRERLGSGGFATVWRAYDPELAADVAVKILADNWIQRSDIRERFLEEARMLRRADSDRVVRVYDIGTLDDGRPYFVMSYADAGTLSDRLAAGPLPIETALRYAAGVARGVAVLHDVGVLHRDIKPSNVLFASAANGERIMLADLGLAKEMAHASGVTLTAGTPGYMSPEQAEPGGGLDRRADVYALGALTFQMLTGRPPDPPRRDRPPQPPSAARREPLPQDIDALVLRALEFDRDRRWPDATAFADAVERLLRHAPAGQTVGPPSTSTAPGPAPSRPVAARRGRWVVPSVAACLVLVLLTVGGYLGYRQLSGTHGGRPSGSPHASAPDLVRTYANEISFRQPRSWRTGSTAPQPTDLTRGMSPFGAKGEGRVLSSVPDFLLTKGALQSHVGVTVVAAKGLAKAPWRKALAAPAEHGLWNVAAAVCTHADHASSDGKAHVRTFGDNCDPDHRPLRQVIAYGSGYAVEVFVVAPQRHADEIDAVIESIHVDGESLP